jgi:hypothetical protein
MGLEIPQKKNSLLTEEGSRARSAAGVVAEERFYLYFR